MTKTVKEESQKKNPLFTMEEAAEFLGTSKPTLYRLLDAKKIKGRKVGNQWRFLKADLQAYLDRGNAGTVLPGVALDLLVSEKAFFTNELSKMGKKVPVTPDQEAEGPEQQIAALVGLLLSHAVAAGAGDIHLEALFDQGEVKYLLRLRIDGVLREIRRMAGSVASAMIACLKNWMSLEGDVRRPQDGRVLMKIDGREVDFRASFMPAIFGDSVVLRILDRKAVALGIPKVGLSEKGQKTLREWASRSHGLLIFTGPSGCGKTTLMYSMLQEISRPALKTMTLEEPVEVAMPWATQIQLNAAQGMTFANSLRSVLRQDPDVIMVGEVRDAETMLGCVQAALTGHLVLTSLHAPDTAAALHRIRDMGIEPFLISSSLVGIAAQRLVRKVCLHCDAAKTLSTEESARMQALAGRSSSTGNGKARYRQGKGCSRCCESGYQGRTGVFEIMEFTPILKEAFLKNVGEDAFRALEIRQGMVSLAAEGVRKAAEGETTAEEVMRVFRPSEGGEE